MTNTANRSGSQSPTLEGSFEATRAHLEAELDALIRDAAAMFMASGTAPLHQSFFDAGGKLLRPRLLFLAAAFGTPDPTQVRRAALGLELLHIGTLYHDDIVDRSPMRRGQPAVYRRVGAPAATWGGAHLICMGNALASELPSDLAASWGRAMLQVADGQLRETENAGSLEVSADQYVRIARLKTASLFELAAILGARLARADPGVCETIRSIGRSIGIAFQLFDDLADFVTDPEDHRAAGVDLRERTYTLPVIYGLASETHGDRLRGLLADDGWSLRADRQAAVVELLHRCGAFSETAATAHSYVTEARNRVDQLPESVPRLRLSEYLDRFEPSPPARVA